MCNLSTKNFETESSVTHVYCQDKELGTLLDSLLPYTRIVISDESYRDPFAELLT